MQFQIRFRTKLLLAAMALGCFVPHSAFGQVVVQRALAVQGMPIQGAQIQDAIKADIARQKSGWQNEMQVVIADIDAVCKLSSEQRSKLEVAAKGAIEKSAKALEEQAAALNGGGGVWVDNAENVQAEENETKDEAVGDGEQVAGEGKEIPPAKNQEDAGEGEANDLDGVEIQAQGAAIVVRGAAMAAPLIMGAAMPFGGNDSPTTNELWTKTMAKVLTADQNKLYLATISTRKQHAVQAHAASFLSDANLKLCLNTDQLAKLQVAVAESYGESLAQTPDAGNGFFAIGGNNGDPSNPEFVKKIKGILSEPQFSIWEMNYQPRLDSAKMMLDMRAQAVVPNAVDEE